MIDNKPKQKKKAGRVVRLTPDLVSLVAKNQREGETIPAVIKRLLGLSGRINYVLPSDLHETVEDARGVAIVRAVRRNIKRAERPVPVRRGE